jgi:hypothetical protein
MQIRLSSFTLALLAEAFVELLKQVLRLLI